MCRALTLSGIVRANVRLNIAIHTHFLFLILGPETPINEKMLKQNIPGTVPALFGRLHRGTARGTRGGG